MNPKKKGDLTCITRLVSYSLLDPLANFKIGKLYTKSLTTHGTGTCVRFPNIVVNEQRKTGPVPLFSRVTMVERRM